MKAIASQFESCNMDGLSPCYKNIIPWLFMNWNISPPWYLFTIRAAFENLHIITRFLGRKSRVTWHFYLRKGQIHSGFWGKKTQNIDRALEMCTRIRKPHWEQSQHPCMLGSRQRWKGSPLWRRPGGMGQTQEPASSYARSFSLTAPIIKYNLLSSVNFHLSCWFGETGKLYSREVQD